MKKLVLLPILLALLLAAFFSCTKDTTTSNKEAIAENPIISMTKDKDGILHLTVMAEPSTTGSAVGERDGCTMYEAMRFVDWDCTSTAAPNEHSDRVEVEEVKFRLIKIYKSTGARTSISSWITAYDVGGLNISWYNQSPLSDYWYATEIEDCGDKKDPSNPSCLDFFICDFWGDDYTVQLDPWSCPDVGEPNADAADFGFGPLLNDNQVIVVCNLSQECVITGEIPLWFCS